MAETNFENATLKLLIEDTDGIVTVASLQQTPTTPSEGGSFLSEAVARVDPSGSDSTGAVGDLTTPFLTVQAALDALQVLDPGYVVIDLGNNVFTENVTCEIGRLIFRGQSRDNSGISSLTLTSKASYVVDFIDCNISDITADASLEIHLQNAACAFSVTSGGNMAIYGNGSGVLTATLSCPGHSIDLRDIWSVNSYVVINSTGSAVGAYNTTISELNAAASVTGQDYRIVTNSAGITPTYADLLLKGVPPGGTTGQVLAKASNADFDTHWVTL